MGIFTFFLTNGPHLAPLIGGFTAQNIGWRYCFSIPAYVQFALVAITFFGLPETLYSRRPETTSTTYQTNSYLDLIMFRSKHLPDRQLQLADFSRPFTMLKYVCVLMPALYYMVGFGYGSVLFASTGSVVFRQFYNFNLIQTGLILSLPLLIGSFIGELNAGRFVDWLIFKHAQRHDGQRPPEPRLDALWLALMLPIGVLIQGICISHSATTSWVGNAFGMGIANFGLQVATTTVYAYSTDVRKLPNLEDILCAPPTMRAQILTHKTVLQTAKSRDFEPSEFVQIDIQCHRFFLRVSHFVLKSWNSHVLTWTTQDTIG